MPNRPCAIAAVVVTAVLGAHCAHHHPRNINFGGRGGGPRNSGSLQLPIVERTETIGTDDRFEVLSGPCRYVATMSGHLDRTQFGSASAPFGAENYEPTITIHARATCDNGASESESQSTLASEGLSREALLRELGGTGVVAVTIDGQRCTLRPDFTLDGERLRITGVAPVCASE
jgi:hypothetical protein